ncbi:hypothetical protein AB0L65_25155 [Nonomuraea sp. NPDC052116]
MPHRAILPGTSPARIRDLTGPASAGPAGQASAREPQQVHVAAGADGAA